MHIGGLLVPKPPSMPCSSGVGVFTGEALFRATANPKPRKNAKRCSCTARPQREAGVEGKRNAKRCSCTATSKHRNAHGRHAKQVEEGAGAVLAFRAALSRAASTQVTFDYATSDGTADVVSDCTPPNAVLTIRAGSSSETIEAPVLDGSHNEGNEIPTRSQG